MSDSPFSLKAAVLFLVHGDLSRPATLILLHSSAVPQMGWNKELALCALQAVVHPYLIFRKALLFWTQCKANLSSYPDSSLASQRGLQLLASQGIMPPERKVGASPGGAASHETPKEEDGNYNLALE